MKKHTIEQIYYLTKEDLKEVATNAEIMEIYKNDSNLQSEMMRLSRTVYMLIDNAYIGVNKENHRKFMRERIDELESMQYYLKQALLEMARSAIYSGMDIEHYYKDGKLMLPETVKGMLYAGELLDGSEKL